MPRSPLSAVRERWDRLTDRERRMMMGLGATLVVVIVGVTIFMVNDNLTTLESDNEAIRQALKDIDSGRDAYQKGKAKTAQLDVRMSRGTVQLQGFLEQAAKTAGVQIDETNERQATPTGGKYVERAVDLRLRKVGIEPLAKFLKQIETGPNLVVVTGLNIRTRDDRHEDLEVELTVSTYERAPAEKPGHKKEKEGKG